jgi:hypothetical protein
MITYIYDSLLVFSFCLFLVLMALSWQRDSKGRQLRPDVSWLGSVIAIQTAIWLWPSWPGVIYLYFVCGWQIYWVFAGLKEMPDRYIAAVLWVPACVLVLSTWLLVSFLNVSTYAIKKLKIGVAWLRVNW